MITLAEFKIFNLLSMSSNTGIRCRGNRDLVSFWNKSRRAMNRADSRYLNLLFDIVDGEAKPWCDSVYRSLVFHDKTLFEKERERFESGAEVIETSFHFWNKIRRAMNRADSNLSTIIFKEALKDYEMLIGEDSKRSESGAGVIETSFHLWNKSRRAMNRADSDSLKSSLRIIP